MGLDLLTVSERIITQVISRTVEEDEEQNSLASSGIQGARILGIDGIFHADGPADIYEEQADSAS